MPMYWLSARPSHASRANRKLHRTLQWQVAASSACSSLLHLVGVLAMRVPNMPQTPATNSKHQHW
eukprot:6253546-Pyramimonas_sp.AAC.1